MSLPGTSNGASRPTGGGSIELRSVGKRYGDLHVVREVSLTVAPGETFVFIGPSGCGKSTTMKMMNRLVEPTSGQVLVDGKDVRELDAAELRLGIGYVIQDVGLFAHYTVARNVGIVPELLGWPAERRQKRVEELLELVGLPPAQYAGRYPRELSGGQRQRAGIARALAADPPIVLLDEPFSALDPVTRERLQDEFLGLSERLGKTFVIVTHDMFEAVKLADKIGVMREGRLVRLGTPREIVDDPGDEAVAALLGRHLYQLRLMTRSLGEVLSAGDGKRPPGTEAPPGGAAVTSLGADASVWDALAQLEADRAELVRVEANGQVLHLTRGALVEAAGGAAAARS